MKKLIIPLLAGVALSCTSSNAQKTDFTDKIHKEFTVANNSFMAIYNLQGSIKVEGYEGNKVIIDIDERITAKNQTEIEKGKNEVQLGFDQNGDSLILFTKYPYDTRPRTIWKKAEWNKEVHYTLHLNYVVKVPKSLNITVSTVNEGEVYVANVNGRIKANNVNGGIALKNVMAAQDVNTVNGNVKINYLALPPENAKYYTLNGDLEVVFPANFSADCQLKTFNGEFFTDFDEFENLPAETVKNIEQREGSTKYKIDKINRVRIGKQGGKNLKFETFNGNIYIKKQS